MIKFFAHLVMASALFVSAASAFSDQLSTDQILQKLENSGALDAAVQRSLIRIKQKELEEQKIKEAKAREARLEQAKNVRPLDIHKDYLFGNPDAEVTLFEYSDFECPYCKRFHDVPKAVVQEMPAQANLVWRNYPLPFHDPMARKEAAAAICAYQQNGSDGFWKYADSIMKATSSNGQGIPLTKGLDPLVNLADSQGLNIKDFQDCLISESTQAKIDGDIANGKAAGISGTPGVILLNHKTGKIQILAGAVPQSIVKDAVLTLLSK